jgi:DNA-directed RNA polymerase subunit RPC12/RpoP
MRIRRRGKVAAVTDVATGLGGTASCPSCGAQVTVTGPEVAGRTEVPCPKCGSVVPTGVRAEVAEDLNADEVQRGFQANGYDSLVEVDGPDGLRCGTCGTTSPASGWTVDDVRRASTPDVEGAPEAAVAAVRCPSCGAAGVAVVDDGAPGALAALEGGAL